MRITNFSQRVMILYTQYVDSWWRMLLVIADLLNYFHSRIFNYTMNCLGSVARLQDLTCTADDVATFVIDAVELVAMTNATKTCEYSDRSDFTECTGRCFIKYKQ